METGPEVVHCARSAVESEVRGTESMELPSGPVYDACCGAFVTLSTFPEGDLRGCIGYSMPVMPLGEAIASAARSACHDPRFPDLRKEELDRITVEVTVLTVPEPILYDTPEELLSKVVVGRDGLIIEGMGRRGLLLPQVPTEWGWDAEEYLRHLSMKAGLPPDAWRFEGVRIRSFRGAIWKEMSPYGSIEEI